MHNQVTLIGNVGLEPEIRETKNGTLVANFSLATTSGYGENKRTEWHKVVVWDKLVDVVKNYVHKGKQIFLQGELRTRKWKKQDGVIQYNTEVHIGGYGGVIRLLGSKDDPSATDAAAPSSNDDTSPWDDDIPL